MFAVLPFLLVFLSAIGLGSSTVIFCPYLDLASEVYGREDIPIDLYSAWVNAGSLGQLFHNGCFATLPSDPQLTCQNTGVIFFGEGAILFYWICNVLSPTDSDNL